MVKNCCPHPLNHEEMILLLKNNGLNRTDIKLQILHILNVANHPLSANEVFKKLPANSCHLSTVFRALTQFQEKGLVREIQLGEDFFRYEFIAQLNVADKNKTPTHHHHFVRCRRCGLIQALEECKLDHYEKMIKRLGFSQTQHFLEFTALCQKCAP